MQYVQDRHTVAPDAAPGGLGVLAGDTLRSAADLGLPMVGVSLVHRDGHFFQKLDDEGRQYEEPVAWSPEDLLAPTDARCRVEIEGRQVTVRAWRYGVRGVAGATVPVFLLDTNLPENDPDDRHLTDDLYGGDDGYRLCQEAILGVGGVRLLQALGYTRYEDSARWTELMRSTIALNASFFNTHRMLQEYPSRRIRTATRPPGLKSRRLSDRCCEAPLPHPGARRPTPDSSSPDGLRFNPAIFRSDRCGHPGHSRC